MFENLTMYQALQVAIKNTPKADAIYYQGKRISYRKLDILINQMATFLIKKVGIHEGDVVLISQPNIPESLILLYAVNKIGAVANMVHPFTPYNQLVSIYETSHSKVAFVFEQRVAKEITKYRQFPYPLYVTRIEDYLPFIKRFVYHCAYDYKIRKKLNKKTAEFKSGFKYLKRKLYKEDILVPTVNNDKTKPAVILHSGSTTGEPKSILLSNDNFNATAELSCEILNLSPEYVKGKAMLSVLPNFHGFGLCMTMHSPMVNSFASVLIPKFSTKAVVKAINGAKNVISICGVPKIYDALNQCSSFWKSKYLKKIHVCFCGGDTLSKQTNDTFNRLMKEHGSTCALFQGYGLSETTSVIVVNTYPHHKPDSLGYPLRGTSVKIVGEDRQEIGINKIGEIVIKSPNNMLGYLDDPSLTNFALVDGYLYTGDLGYLDEDGFLFFTSRMKRVVKVSGVATFPNEVEKLIRSIPGVDDVCVVGEPDAIMGHALKAYVVTNYIDKEALREQILLTCQKYLIRWSVPKHIEYINEIPKTVYNKNDYRKLEQ